MDRRPKAGDVVSYMTSDWNWWQDGKGRFETFERIPTGCSLLVVSVLDSKTAPVQRDAAGWLMDMPDDVIKVYFFHQDMTYCTSAKVSSFMRDFQLMSSYEEAKG
jgi:hypothetical protein